MQVERDALLKCSWRTGAGDWVMGTIEKGTALFWPSLPQTSSLKLNELVLHLLVSQLSMVRSVKVTLSSASIRIIVLVLKGT